MRLFLPFIFLSSLFALGCRQADPTPELRDPIYADIQSKLKEAELVKKEAVEKFKFTQQLVERIQPQTEDYQASWKKYFEADQELRKAEQMIHYWNLKLISRKYSSRNSYIRHYNNKNEDQWPKLGEYHRYTTNQRLMNAPRKWDSKKMAELHNKQ